MSPESERGDVWWDLPSKDIHLILPELLAIPGVVLVNNFDYDLMTNLGNGMTGSVIKCQHRKTGEFVAIKCIGAAILDKSEDSRKKVLREVRITSALSVVQKGVIGLSKIFVHDDRIFIAMEIAEGGDLFEVIMARKGGLPERDALPLFRQMVEAVSFLHDIGICHRDIKPENFLLTEKGEIKLCDFGFCANFFKEDGDSDDGENAHLPFCTPCGTTSYLAPEIVLGHRYSHEIDVWSLGVTFYTMLSGLDPWGSPAKARPRILKGDYSLLSHISKDANDLLRRMLEPNPAHRITVREILQTSLLLDAAPQVTSGKDLLLGVSPKTLARLSRRNVVSDKERQDLFRD